MNPGVRVVPVVVQQAPEGVLHGARRGGIDVALDGRQVHDALAGEIVGDADALRVDAVQRVHPGGGLVAHPVHVAVFKVVQDGDAVALEDRDIVVQILALEGRGHHGAVLDADLLRVASPRERPDGALQLPGRGVRAGERVVPRDVVLQDHRAVGRQELLDAGQPDEAVVIVEDGFGRGAQNGYLGSRRHGCSWLCGCLPTGALYNGRQGETNRSPGTRGCRR